MSTKQPLVRRLVVLGLAGSLLLGAPTAALAQSTDAADRVAKVTDRPTDQPPVVDLEAARRRLLAAIDRRLETLERLTNVVTGHPHVTDRHEAKLLADYARAAQGLRELRTRAEAATTREELKEIAESMVVDYRIYLVVVPKTYGVLFSDTVVAAADRMDEFADRLAEAIERAAEAGYDVSEARRWLVVARDEIDEGRRAGGPVADMVIDLEASDYPEPATSTFADAKRRLENARLDLREARKALTKSLTALREAIGGNGG
ncbi:MAG TPA: hypothetical protein ENK55_11615 [Actinobacteria bacterium]|nr:hypothetical protein [Actinomycetota bacterium]